jgi:predicted molibdopterin-dependent oxidoreductase YjgC
VPEAASFGVAIEAAAARLRKLVASKGAGVIAGLASPHATNEDLFTFRRLLDALGTETAGVAVVQGESDALLVKADKAANAAGARALGFGDARAVLDRLRSGGVDGLIVMGHDVLDAAYLGGVELLAKLDTLIVLDTHHSALERVAHVLLPVRVAAEKHGTLTNHAGRVQKVVPAVEPAWEALAEGEVLTRLGHALALAGWPARWDVLAVSKELAAAHPAFSGRDLGSLPPEGAPLATAQGAAPGARA